MKRKLFAMLMALTLVLTYMPAIAFADGEGEPPIYSAEYFGEPSSITLCPDGENVDIEPADEDYIIIHKDDSDIRCEFDFIYDEDNDSYYYVLYNTDEEDNNYIDSFNGWYISPTEVEISVSGHSLDDNNDEIWWYAEGRLNNVNVYNEVTKIVFEPASATTLYSEDIRNKDEDGNDYLDFGKRVKHSAGGQTWYSGFAVGDKLTVYYDNDRTKTFVNKDVCSDGDWYDEFYCGDEWIYVYAWPVEELKAGVNKVEVEYHGRTTTFNITLETPESRAKAKAEAEAAAKAKAEAAAKAKAAAEEAARQGVPDNSIPKVKASKPATKKATVTVKWKKLNKKQLKKSKATHYEIWICENKGFAKGLTKEKIVKKGKASFKFTGLKKNTKYYVQVRAIKYVGGIKHVGKWSQKTIKTKKK